MRTLIHGATDNLTPIRDLHAKCVRLTPAQANCLQCREGFGHQLRWHHSCKQEVHGAIINTVWFRRLSSLLFVMLFVAQVNTCGRLLANQTNSPAYWSLQFTNWPPLPFNPFPTLDLYAVDSNNYAYDDREVDYVQLREQAVQSRMSAMYESVGDPPPSPGGTNDWGADPGVEAAVAYKYSTNDLWLEIITFTNHTAALVIHPPWNETNMVHDLFYTTNLTAPINWRFVMRATTTNVLVPDLCDQQGFFRLGRTNGDLTVTTNVTPLQMAQMLVPPWVTVANASYTGADVARGTFSGGHGCGLPIETGVILSSGEIGLAVGTNNSSFATGANGEPSDPDLGALVGGGPAFEAAVLELTLFRPIRFACDSRTSSVPRNIRSTSANTMTRWPYLSQRTIAAQTGLSTPATILR